MTPDFAALRVVDSMWKEGPEVEWDSGASGTAGRVRGFHRIRFGALVLKESPAPVNPELAQARLREELRKSWPRPFDDDSDLRRWQERLLVYSDAMKEDLLLDLSGPDFEFLLDAIVESKSSFADITMRRLGEYIEDLLGYADAKKIADACPEHIKLASGRAAAVHYRAGQPPWVEGKIQEFFGTQKMPVVVYGRLGLVVHLLAPNNRPVQVTGDLAGFWKNHYPALRRELSRDYPRHFWPEDPLTAEARVFLRPRR
jgi:ATP-dependent helicase HrpB